MVDKGIKYMKTRKALGPSRVTVEMFKVSGRVDYGIVTCIVNQVIQESRIPSD